jgi:hypothetical protein
MERFYSDKRICTCNNCKEVRIQATDYNNYTTTVSCDDEIRNYAISDLNTILEITAKSVGYTRGVKILTE